MNATNHQLSASEIPDKLVRAPSGPQTTNPTLKGWITTFYIPYGNKKLGPYYTRTWKQNGKLKRQYIKHEDLEKVKAACQRHREQRQNLATITKTYATVAANLNFLYRMLKRTRTRKPRKDESAHLHHIDSHGLKTNTRPPIRRKRSFMYPQSTKPSRKLMNPFYNRAVPCHPERVRESNRQKSAIDLPDPSPDHAAKLAALKAPPSWPTSQGRWSDMKSPFPKPAKVVRYYIWHGNDDDPEPPKDSPFWEPSPGNDGVPDANGMVYEYYEYNDPNPPNDPPNPAWDEWLARDAEKNRLRTLQQEDTP